MFTDKLFSAVQEIWEEYLEHPFVKGIATGTLDKEKFKNYLIQDYLYLKDYSKVFCVGIIKATTMEEMRFYYNSIQGTMNDETAVHIEYLKGFGYDEVEIEREKNHMVTSSYVSYMQAQALTGGLKEITAAVLPCTWSYSYIGRYIKENYSDSYENNFYKPWIDVYSSDDYTVFTDQWIDYTNNLCKDLSEEEEEKLIDIFRLSSIYEMQFWDMAFE